MPKLVKIARGKKTILLEGDRKKLTNRLKQLKSSTRKGACGRTGNKYNVEYRIEEDE